MMLNRNRALYFIGFLAILSLSIVFRPRTVPWVAVELTESPDDEVPQIVGIELGNDYARVGIITGDKSDGPLELFKDREGHSSIPSFVAFTDQGPLIGHAAKEQAPANPNNTIYDIRNLIGRKFSDSDLQADIKSLPYNVVEQDGKPVIKVQVNGSDNLVTPETVSSMILGKLKSMAEDYYLGQRVPEAVIAVPVSFDDVQREAVRNAAAQAGLQVLRLITEPVAAGIGYGIDRDHRGCQDSLDGTFSLIVNLGNRQFETALVEVDCGVFETLASVRDDYFDTQGFRAALLNDTITQTSSNSQVDITEDLEAIERLKLGLEKIEQTLFTAPSADILIPTHHDYPEYVGTIGEPQVRRLRNEVSSKIIDSMKQVLQEAKVGGQELDTIILVGSPALISYMTPLLPSWFPSTPILDNTLIPPELAIVHGTASQAYVLSTDSEMTVCMLSSFISASVSIETPDGGVHRLLSRHTSIPSRARIDFRPEGKEVQDGIVVRVVEGESPSVGENKLLGILIWRVPEWSEEMGIEVVLEVDDDQLSVRMREDKREGEREVMLVLKNVLE